MFGRILYAFSQNVLSWLSPEAAHDMTIFLLGLGVAPKISIPDDPRLHFKLYDMTFTHPLGLAAGLDKNADALSPLLGMGFSFVEAGSVTPLPQLGGNKPRIFRLPEEKALINRLGFNNNGHQYALENLQRFRADHDPKHRAIIGINLGANKQSEDRIKDYETGLETFIPYASYVTLNVSSPNTPHLRRLQEKQYFKQLLDRALRRHGEIASKTNNSLPIFIKISPDLKEESLKNIALEIKRKRIYGRIDGVIISNTTTRRDILKTNKLIKQQTGGLSGAPLFDLSTIVLAKMYEYLGPDIPLIGLGGIDSPQKAWIKITAGARLLQLYTGLVYQGPYLIRRIVQHLSKQLDHHKMNTLEEAVGMDAQSWAKKPLSGSDSDGD